MKRLTVLCYVFLNNDAVVPGQLGWKHGEETAGQRLRCYRLCVVALRELGSEIIHATVARGGPNGLRKRRNRAVDGQPARGTLDVVDDLG